jgi:hypothetical protein
MEGAGGRESACPEASVGNSGSWSAATEEEWVVILRVGSMEEEGGQAVVLVGELSWQQRAKNRGRVAWRWRRRKGRRALGHACIL